MAERDSTDHEDLLVRELLSNQEPQRLAPSSAGPIQLWGCLCCAEPSSPGPWLSRGALSHRVAVYSPAPHPAIHFCSAGGWKWLRCGVTPRPPVGRLHGIRTPLQCAVLEEGRVCKNGTTSSSLSAQI